MTKLYPRAFSKCDGLFLRSIGPPRLNSRHCVLGLIFFAAFFLIPGSRLLGNNRPAAKGMNKKIKTLVERFRRDLSIKEEVFVSIVPKNDRLVSVERWKKVSGAFLLSFDENFLAALNDSELSASIAHELGHVWIFTHHPYLQTELLANQIALKVVTREELERVYEKVWKDRGKGNLRDFLGEDTAVGLKPRLPIKPLPRITDEFNQK
jgi:hypothetical protein